MVNEQASMTTVVDVPPGRTADRRRGAAALVAAAACGAAIVRDPRGARERLMEELRLALGARFISVREEGIVSRPPLNVCAIELPVAAGTSRARVDVVFDSPRLLDEWSGQLVDAAAHLLALLLDIERAGPRIVTWSGLSDGDGAAPLIGSSEAMRRIRDRIERVAATPVRAQKHRRRMLMIR